MFEFRLHTFIIFFVPSRGLEELNVRLFCIFTLVHASFLLSTVRGRKSLEKVYAEANQPQECPGLGI